MSEYFDHHRETSRPIDDDTLVDQALSPVDRLLGR